MSVGAENGTPRGEVIGDGPTRVGSRLPTSTLHSLSLSPSSQMASNSLRQLPRSFRTNLSKRFYSTPPSSTQQSGEQLQKKATEFAASAQETLNKAWGVTKKSLGPFGERLAGALGCRSPNKVTEVGMADASFDSIQSSCDIQPAGHARIAETGLRCGEASDPPLDDVHDRVQLAVV